MSVVATGHLPSFGPGIVDTWMAWRDAGPGERPALLVGRTRGDHGSSVPVVTALVPVDGPATTAFVVPIAALLAAEEQAGKQGLTLLGLVHHHPGGEGPSAFDLAIARQWPAWTFVIDEQRCPGAPPTWVEVRSDPSG